MDPRSDLLRIGMTNCAFLLFAHRHNTVCLHRVLWMPAGVGRRLESDTSPQCPEQQCPEPQASLRRPVLRRYCYILIDLLRSTVTPRHVLLDKGEELSSLSCAFVEACPSWTCLRKNPEEKVSELCENCH